MSSVAVGLIVFACLFCGALLGVALHSRLPSHHLGEDSKHLVEVGIGIIGTMAALVLGLLVGTATSSYNTQRNELMELSAKVILLDRTLAHYGPEAQPSRAALRSSVANAIDRIWPVEGSGPAQLVPASDSGPEVLFDEVEKLAPKTDEQRALKPEAASLLTNLAQTRWLMFTQSSGGVSLPMLVIMVFWFTLTFVGFGLFAPPNTTVIATLLLCAFSVAAAIVLVLDLFTPFQGVVRLSSEPLRLALAQLGQ
jgi:Protein of unknown function (DUF4239)